MRRRARRASPSGCARISASAELRTQRRREKSSRDLTRTAGTARRAGPRRTREGGVNPPLPRSCEGGRTRSRPLPERVRQGGKGPGEDDPRARRPVRPRPATRLPRGRSWNSGPIGHHGVASRPRCRASGRRRRAPRRGPGHRTADLADRAARRRDGVRDGHRHPLGADARRDPLRRARRHGRRAGAPVRRARRFHHRVGARVLAAPGPGLPRRRPARARRQRHGRPERPPAGHRGARRGLSRLHPAALRAGRPGGRDQRRHAQPRQHARHGRERVVRLVRDAQGRPDPQRERRRLGLPASSDTISAPRATSPSRRTTARRRIPPTIARSRGSTTTSTWAASLPGWAGDRTTACRSRSRATPSGATAAIPGARCRRIPMRGGRPSGT